MKPLTQKESGAFFTPTAIAVALTRWVAQSPTDRMLDPSCGDGQFLVNHPNSVGVEQDSASALLAASRAPEAIVHNNDFFTWAAGTCERFECLAGNPPFIRYQLFKGETRARALEQAARLGAKFSGVSSSWAPYLVVAASLLKAQGRMAFVVPAEIGHAPYSLPLLKYLTASFGLVQVVAVRKKLFPNLSEDCWLLYCDDFGGSTDHILLTATDTFELLGGVRPLFGTVVPIGDLEQKWEGRLRPYLLTEAQRAAYQLLKSSPETSRLKDLARVSLGYVSGANEFFHLRPSEVTKFGIPAEFLQLTARNSRSMEGETLTADHVKRWLEEDACCYLLRIEPTAVLPGSLLNYLQSDAAAVVRQGYKCRNRAVWYSIPDVQTPPLLLTYMAGKQASLIANKAKVACTNSLHCVTPYSSEAEKLMQKGWTSALTQLSCEIEGHPLGGGMLKLEINEAKRILFNSHQALEPELIELFDSAATELRRWRHYA